MSVFRTAMVWLGLVDDDEYDGEDDQYYLDEEYEDAAPAAAPAPARRARHGSRPPARRQEIEPGHRVPWPPRPRGGRSRPSRRSAPTAR